MQAFDNNMMMEEEYISTLAGHTNSSCKILSFCAVSVVHSTTNELNKALKHFKTILDLLYWKYPFLSKLTATF